MARTKSNPGKGKSSKGLKAKKTMTDKAKRRALRKTWASEFSTFFDEAYEWMITFRDPFASDFPQEPTDIAETEYKTIEDYLAYHHELSLATFLENLIDSNGACRTPLRPKCQMKLWAYIRNNKHKFSKYFSTVKVSGESRAFGDTQLSKWRGITVEVLIRPHTVVPLTKKMVADLRYFVVVVAFGREPQWNKYAIHNATGLKDSTYRFLRPAAFLIVLKKVKFVDDVLKDMKENFQGNQNQWKQAFKSKCDTKLLPLKKKAVPKEVKPLFEFLKRVFGDYYNSLGQKPTFKKLE